MACEREKRVKCMSRGQCVSVRSSALHVDATAGHAMAGTDKSLCLKSIALGLIIIRPNIDRPATRHEITLNVI